MVQCKKASRIKWWMWAAFLHFICTFVWSRLVFRAGEFDMGLKILSTGISARQEALIHTVYARGLAFLLILLLWWMIGSLFAGGFTKREIATFFGTFFVLLFLVGIGFPQNFFQGEQDNLLTFAHAIRNQPFYWHGALTSIYYAACLYVLPHPFAIQTVTLLAVSVIVVLGLYRVKGAWCFVLLAVILPETMIVITFPYRNNLYAVLLVLTLLLVLQQKQRGRAPSPTGKMVFLFLFAVLAVWRTEGLFFALALFGVLFAGSFQTSLKEFGKATVVFLAMVVLLSAPQKPGNAKYHGKDYLILTTTEWLPACLNVANSNVSYEGAVEDLQAIDRVVPVEMIRALGSRAFHKNNFESGRSVIQTACTESEAAAYMKASFRIVLHNLVPFIKGRWNLAMAANGGRLFLGVGEYMGEPVSFDDGVIYGPIRDQWAICEEEMYQMGFCQQWQQWNLRIRLNEVLAKGRELFGDGLNLRFLLLGAACVALVVWFCRLCRTRKLQTSDWQTALLLCVAIAELGIVTVGAPEPRAAYYYPVYYFLLAVMSVRICRAFGKRRETKEQTK